VPRGLELDRATDLRGPHAGVPPLLRRAGSDDAACLPSPGWYLAESPEEV